jgi:hypothetical protein
MRTGAWQVMPDPARAKDEKLGEEGEESHQKQGDRH